MTPFSPEMRRNPYPLYAQIRSASPVFHFEPTDVFMVLDHEGTKRVLTDHETFGSNVSPGSSVERWIIFMDPPRHSRLRALVNRAFTAAAVHGLEPRIRELSRTLLDAVAARGELDLVGEYALPLPLMVIAEMLGTPASDWRRLHAWSDVMLGLSLTITGGEEAERAQARYVETTAEMQRYLEPLLDERRTTPRNDLFTRLLQAEVDGERLSVERILGFFQLLLIAGHETTTNLISNAILSLLEHPEERARLDADPTLLPSAIEETLRYRAPVQATFRVTKREVTLHGRTIGEGKLVLPMIGAANRDPAVFADPDRFDVGRTPNPHLAFGHGIHFCIGAPLSRLEAKIALPDILSRLRHLRFASDAPWRPRDALHVHGPSQLLLRFDP